MNGTADIQTANRGRVTFTTPHWSVVLQAQDETPGAQKALEMLSEAFSKKHGVCNTATGGLALN